MAFGNFFGNENALKVDAGIMISKANEVEQKVREMKAQFSEMERMINESAGHWYGEAGDLHRSLYNNKKGDIDTIVSRLAQHPVNLREAARIYAGLASENELIQSALPSDVIS